MERRIFDEAAFVADTGATIRVCAAKYAVSKTTVHKDLRTRLPRMDPELAKRVGKMLDVNLAQRHLRGGEATKQKYSARRENGQTKGSRRRG